MKILLVDDESSIRVTLGNALNEAGHRVVLAASAGEAREKLAADGFDCVITDLRLPDASGADLLREVKSSSPATTVFVITGHGSIESAVEAMRLGAADYITKPFLNEDLLLRIERIERVRRLEEENRRLREELHGRSGLGSLVGRSAGMQRVFTRIETVAASGSWTILVTGESGTGKELVARAVHSLSDRAKKPFVAFSSAALPETLIEDELFGHERGAFTDAKERRVGRLEEVAGGTLLLDDIDDMPQTTQAKLLRVIEEREFRRLGGTKPIQLEARIIAATKAPLAGRVEEGRFRADLFYRLNVVPIEIPPLRERMEDVPLLVEHFVRLHSGGKPYRVSEAALRALATYHWPGNVRELENAIKRAIALSGGEEELSAAHLLPEAPQGTATATSGGGLREALAVAEKAFIAAALEKTGGNRTKTAERLGISRKSLWEKIGRHGL